jgi:tRNA A37 methylthiotransferase MiaB
MAQEVSVGKRVCVAFGLGCPRAQVDTARLFKYFEANGWSVTDSIEDSDLVLVTSCGFSRQFEDSSVQLIEAAERRRRPDSELVVVGCLAGINADRLQRTFQAALLPPMGDSGLDAVIGATIALSDVDDPIVIEPYIDRASRCFTEEERRGREHVARAVVRRLFRASGMKRVLGGGSPDDGSVSGGRTGTVCSLRVAQGCLGECSYCAIRFATGTLHSKSLQKVMAEFDEGLALGYAEFRLIAGDLGCYGQDIGSSIVELLGALMQRPQDFRLTLQDLDLKWFIRYKGELTELLTQNRARIRAVLLPLQSGSERILSLMRRGHTAQDAREALCALRAANPDMVLDTHVLIGFPGESDDDFEDTLRFVKAVRFSHVTGYDYEDRPGTDASRMTPKVPRRVIRARGFRLRREIAGPWDAMRYYVQEWGLRPPPDPLETDEGRGAG